MVYKLTNRTRSSSTTSTSSRSSSRPTHAEKVEAWRATGSVHNAGKTKEYFAKDAKGNTVKIEKNYKGTKVTTYKKETPLYHLKSGVYGTKGVADKYRKQQLMSGFSKWKFNKANITSGIKGHGKKYLSLVSSMQMPWLKYKDPLGFPKAVGRGVVSGIGGYYQLGKDVVTRPKEVWEGIKSVPRNWRGIVSKEIERATIDPGSIYGELLVDAGIMYGGSKAINTLKKVNIIKATNKILGSGATRELRGIKDLSKVKLKGKNLPRSINRLSKGKIRISDLNFPTSLNQGQKAKLTKVLNSKLKSIVRRKIPKERLEALRKVEQAWKRRPKRGSLDYQLNKIQKGKRYFDDISHNYKRKGLSSYKEDPLTRAIREAKINKRTIEAQRKQAKWIKEYGKGDLSKPSNYYIDLTKIKLKPSEEGLRTLKRIKERGIRKGAYDIYLDNVIKETNRKMLNVKPYSRKELKEVWNRFYTDPLREGFKEAKFKAREIASIKEQARKLPKLEKSFRKGIIKDKGKTLSELYPPERNLPYKRALIIDEIKKIGRAEEGIKKEILKKAIERNLNYWKRKGVLIKKGVGIPNIKSKKLFTLKDIYKSTPEPKNIKYIKNGKGTIQLQKTITKSKKKLSQQLKTIEKEMKVVKAKPLSYAREKELILMEYKKYDLIRKRAWVNSLAYALKYAFLPSYLNLYSNAFDNIYFNRYANKYLEAYSPLTKEKLKSKYPQPFPAIYPTITQAERVLEDTKEKERYKYPEVVEEVPFFPMRKFEGIKKIKGKKGRLESRKGMEYIQDPWARITGYSRPKYSYKQNLLYRQIYGGLYT